MVGNQAAEPFLGIAIGAGGVERSNSSRSRLREDRAGGFIAGTAGNIGDAVMAPQLRRAEGELRQRRVHAPPSARMRANCSATSCQRAVTASPTARKARAATR